MVIALLSQSLLLWELADPWEGSAWHGQMRASGMPDQKEEKYSAVYGHENVLMEGEFSAVHFAKELLKSVWCEGASRLVVAATSVALLSRTRGLDCDSRQMTTIKTNKNIEQVATLSGSSGRDWQGLRRLPASWTPFVGQGGQ